MSNLSILERLESSLAAYAEGTVTRAAFVDFLSNSIRALEGVPFTVIHELRWHEYAIETEGYSDEEGFESQPELAQVRLLAWIHELKQVDEPTAEINVRFGAAAASQQIVQHS